MEKPHNLDRNRVASKIMLYIQNIQTEGATDAGEINGLHAVLNDLNLGKITAEEAERRADAIVNSRQDYH
jgi:hypothetical protein